MCAGCIDLVLGGHDHHYEVAVENGIHIFKSGTDFRNLSEIWLEFTPGSSKPTVSWKRHDVTKGAPTPMA